MMMMMMIFRLMLDFDDFEDDAGFWCFGACCWISMILSVMLDFYDFEDHAGFS